jgi:hypothetical protein
MEVYALEPHSTKRGPIKAGIVGMMALLTWNGVRPGWGMSEAAGEWLR